MSDYFHNNELGEDIFNRKYKSYEDETFKDRIETVCNEISKVDNDDEYKDIWFKQIYEDNVWMPGGSIIASVGVDSKTSVYNCTTIEIEDDTLEAISEARYKLLKYAAYRQGIGVEFSKLRPNGSALANSAKVSTGPLNWMKDFDEAANHVGQNGRKPALLFSLKDNHPDFPEFIDLKTSYDNIVNANISAHISDDFMRAVESNSEWLMVFDAEHDIIERRENARELFRRLCLNNLDFAEPGIQFIDIIRRYSNSDYVGIPVTGSNACSEKFLDSDGACNLGSINLEKVPDTRDGIDIFMEYHIPYIVRFLDNVITYEEINSKHSPSKKQLESQANLRRLGIGVTNLHAWLIKVDYNMELLDYLFESLMYYAYKASSWLGAEKGDFKAFDMKKFRESPYVKMMEKLGLSFMSMRNAELLAIAPTGTISMLFREPVISYGIEPAFGLYYWKRTRISGKYEYYFVVPSIVDEILKENGIDLGMSKLIIRDDFMGSKGKIYAKIINDNIDLFKGFKPANKWSISDKLNILSIIQKHIDSSISTTFILPETATVDDVFELYIDAWKSKLKAVTAYRDSSRYGIVEFIPFYERAKQLLSQGKKLYESNFSEDEKKLLKFGKSKKFKQNGDVRIHKFIAEGGDKFYVVVGPRDIFIINYKEENRANERILAIANRLGELVKSKDESLYKRQLERSENRLNRFTRMLSSCYKIGLLNKALDILDENAIVGNLAWYIVRKVFNYRKKSIKCFVCGSDNVVPTDDGCFICLDCGSTKCE